VTVGRGRVAVFGEAAMFTAQVSGPERRPMGMNTPTAAQNPQFLLNVMHWLAGLLPANVEGGKFPFDREGLDKPAVLVGYIREAGITLVYSATDQVPLDFQVAVLKPNDQSNVIEDQYPKWREQIRNLFSPTTDTGLPAVPHVISTQVIPGDMYNLELFKVGLDAGALVIRCITQVNRALV